MIIVYLCVRPGADWRVLGSEWSGFAEGRHHERVMTAFIVTGLGILVELVGLSLAAVGFRNTWREFAVNDRFLSPIAKVASAARERVNSATKRILRQRPEPKIVALSAASFVVAAGSVRATKNYGPLPLMADDPAKFSEIVQARLDELLTRVQEADHRVLDQLKAADERQQKIVATLNRRIAALEATAQKIAVGGIRQQAAGLILVAVGLLVQSLGQFLQAAAGAGPVQ